MKTQQPSVLDRFSKSVITRLARRLRGGTLVISEPGSVLRVGDGEGPEASIEIHRPDVWRRLLFRGGNGLGESYFLGEWDSPDPQLFLRLLTRNLDQINARSRRWRPLTNALRRPLAKLGAPSKRKDRENIAAHYDLGNEFFSLFLDETMAYSSGVFQSPEVALAAASIEKFDRLCRKLELNEDAHVVEIGTGWGGFAVHAASTYGCRVTTTTISARQFEHATALVKERGLEHLVTVLNSDYRDVKGPFTHLVSIEMIEAVDWRHYDTFFQACQNLLVPEGRAALQCIVIADQEFERYKTGDDFIRRYIFPGGCLPSVTAMADATTKFTDLRLVDLEDLGAHYVQTLDEWRERLDEKWAEAMGLGLSEQFLRMWRFYFLYCAAGFAERHVSVVQVVFARPKWRSTVALRND